MQASVTPHSLEAERAVLGAILVHDERIFEIADRLAPSDFFRVPHQWIYAAMIELAKTGTPIDRITICEQLRQAGKLEEVGGPAYLAGLMDGVPRSTNVAYYAGIVSEKAGLRKVLAITERTRQSALGEETSVEAVLDEADHALSSIMRQRSRGDFISATKLVEDGFPALERMLDKKQGTTGLETGFRDFDEMSRGLQPGALCLLAARPSMGKTSFALNVAHHVAAHGQTVGFFSLEMSRQEVFMRLIASVGQIDSHRLQRGYANQTDYARVSHACGEIAASRLFIDDAPSLGVLELRGRARRLKAQHGLGLVVLDYLQLMQLGRAENRNLAVADASRSLKLLARELEVPVLALSQLSRETERSGEKKPLLSHLRDSGALEQDADLVMFIHRPEVYAATPENDGVAELIIAKARNGPIGSVTLRWNKASTRFESAA